MRQAENSARPDWDRELVDIVDYVRDARIDSDLAWQTARHILVDSLGCALQALEYSACTRLLGPVV